jgi:hypothetical protein
MSEICGLVEECVERHREKSLKTRSQLSEALLDWRMSRSKGVHVEGRASKILGRVC